MQISQVETQKSKSESEKLLASTHPLLPSASTPPTSSVPNCHPALVFSLLSLEAIGGHNSDNWGLVEFRFAVHNKSAWVDVILTASFICLSRQLWKLPTTSIENSCFSPLYPSLQSFCQNLSNNGKSFSLFSSANWYPQYLVGIWQWGAPNANDISLQIFVPVHSNSKC